MQDLYCVNDFLVFLFDLDGTLLDTQSGVFASLKYSFDKMQIDSKMIKAPLQKFIGPPLLFSYQEYCSLSEKQSVIAMQYYREYYEKQGILEAKVYEGIKEALECLKQQGKTLVVATSKPQVYAKKVIKHFALDKYFDFVCGGDIKEKNSSKKVIIQTALQKTKFFNKSQKVLMIGDRFYDIQGAKQNNIKAAGVLWGFGTQIELKTAGANYILQNPLDLVSNIKYI